MTLRLLIKDVRLCWLPILCGMLAMAGGSSFGVLIVNAMGFWNSDDLGNSLGLILWTGGYFAILIAQPVLGIIAGMSVSVERQGQTMDWFRMVLVDRDRLAQSKLLFVCGCSAMVWVWGGLLFVTAWLIASDSEALDNFVERQADLSTIFAWGIMSMGCGWQASASARTTGPCIALALAAPVVAYVAIELASTQFGWPQQSDATSVVRLIWLMVGFAGFAFGYLRMIRKPD